MANENNNGEFRDQNSCHIQDALDAAFCVNSCRPLLVHIHHDNSTMNLFSSDILNEFLRENYIVCSWNITNERDRNILIEIWNEIFPQQSFINFSMHQCPILISITRGILPFEYKSNILFTRDVLEQIDEQFQLEVLLYQLIDIKEKFVKNEKFLLSDFIQKTGFCWELVLEIIPYLSLNDAIRAFSLAILPLLSKYQIKLPIICPCEEFMKTIMPKINYEQINALSLDASQYKKTMGLISSNKFNNIESLTLYNLEKILQIDNMKKYFPKLIRLSINYNNEVDFHCLCKIFNLIPDSIQRFEVHCGTIRCSPDRSDFVFIKVYDFNTTIKFVEFNIKHISSSLINRCSQKYSKCILRTIADVIKIMSKIENIQIIVDKGNIETFLDVNIWQILVNECKQLNKITLKVLKNLSEDKQSIEKIQQIENELKNIRQSIQFQVKVK